MATSLNDLVIIRVEKRTAWVLTIEQFMSTENTRKKVNSLQIIHPGSWLTTWPGRTTRACLHTPGLLLFRSFSGDTAVEVSV